MSRHDLTKWESGVIRHFLPAQSEKQHGLAWVNHRTTINGILWILKTSNSWRDLPVEFWKWQTVFSRF